MTGRPGLVEPSARPEAVWIVERLPEEAAVVSVEGSVAELPAKMGEAFRVTAEAITDAGAAFAGPPFTRYHDFGQTIRADAGFPVAGPMRPTPPVSMIELPGGRAVMTTHVGPYSAIGEAWERATTWMAEHGLHPTSAPWERYLTGPDEPGPPVTEVVWPVD